MNGFVSVTRTKSTSEKNVCSILDFLEILVNEDHLSKIGELMEDDMVPTNCRKSGYLSGPHIFDRPSLLNQEIAHAAA